MTKLINGILVIEAELPDTCELCDAFEELRPYGPNGERICFECGMKNEKTTNEAFGKLLNTVFRSH